MRIDEILEAQHQREQDRLPPRPIPHDLTHAQRIAESVLDRIRANPSKRVILLHTVDGYRARLDDGSPCNLASVVGIYDIRASFRMLCDDIEHAERLFGRTGPRNAAKPDRDAAVVAMRRQGRSQAEIGTVLGISPTRVSQILARQEARELFGRADTREGPAR